jgi:hypothetical protein
MVQTVCLQRVFEPYARDVVVYLYRAWMACVPTAFAWGSIAQHDFFSQGQSFLPVFVSTPEFVIAEEACSFQTILFVPDLLWCGVGVGPGLDQQLLGCVRRGHDQGACLGAHGIILAAPLHEGWQVACGLSPEPVRHIPAECCASLAAHPGWPTGTSVVCAPSPCESLACVYLGTCCLFCGARGKHCADFGAKTGDGLLDFCPHLQAVIGDKTGNLLPDRTCNSHVFNSPSILQAGACCGRPLFCYGGV